MTTNQNRTIPKGTQLDLFSMPDSERVAVIITTCQTCFRKFTGIEMGIDGRYCKECEGNLNDEWQAMAQRGVKIKLGWVPRNGNQPHRNRKAKHNGNGTTKELPKKKIKTLAAKGMSSKRIAAELIKDGYSINYRAIAKMVKGSGRNDRTRQGAKAKRLPATSKA